MKHWLKSKRLIMIVLGIASTGTFGQFIIEEALQNYGFGIGSVIISKQYYHDPEGTLVSLAKYKAFQDDCDTIMHGLYFFNPLTAIWFEKFMVSNRLKIETWENMVVSFMRWKDKKEAEEIETLKKKALDKGATS